MAMTIEQQQVINFEHRLKEIQAVQTELFELIEKRNLNLQAGLNMLADKLLPRINHLQQVYSDYSLMPQTNGQPPKQTELDHVLRRKFAFLNQVE